MEPNTNADDEHPLNDVLMYEEQAELVYKNQRPAVVFDDGTLHDYDIAAIRDAGYRILQVLDSSAHRKAADTPLYIFEEIDD